MIADLSTRSRFSRFTLPLLAVVAAGLGGCISKTYGTGEYPETAIFREVTGGMVSLIPGNEKKNEINYQTRAPLVEPPAASLREPVQTASVSDPNWPVDHDSAAKPEYSDEINQEYLDRVEPLAALGRQQPKQERDNSTYYGQLGIDSPQEFGRKRAEQKEFVASVEAVEGAQCAERRYLTEPPTKFCQPAETAPQEFEEIDKEKKGFFGGLFGG